MRRSSVTAMAPTGPCYLIGAVSLSLSLLILALLALLS